MKKILAFTSIRSEYGLMRPLYKLLHDDDEIELKIIVSGAHLSSAYGYSVQEVESDGFDILLRVETLINSDSSQSRVKSASMLLQNITDVVSGYSPDLMVYAGDREDILMYAMLGGFLNIPTVHFYSGDHTSDGYIDNPIRHASSKLSTVHFVALEQHKRRLMKMGEDKKRIFTVGNISLDRFSQFSPPGKSDLLKSFGINPDVTNFALMIFHPITEEMDRVKDIYISMLNNLKEKGIFTFVCYPNIDPGNFKILEVIKAYESHTQFYFFKNLGQDEFLSIYMNSEFIIGNSSSGVCEAASIPIPAINVGLRQRGRYATDNVVFCDSDHNSIHDAIDLVLSTGFKQSVRGIENPYGQGNSAKKAHGLIKSIDFVSLLLKKEDALDIVVE